MENHNIKRLIRLSDEYEAYTLKNRREIHKNPGAVFSGVPYGGPGVPGA